MIQAYLALPISFDIKDPDGNDVATPNSAEFKKFFNRSMEPPTPIEGQDPPILNHPAVIHATECSEQDSQWRTCCDGYALLDLRVPALLTCLAGLGYCLFCTGRRWTRQ